ncbi:DUF1697 domain-containing protein [Microvirga rosea]|uniref:DUF1697 domain-containing protein n=1 Tax=Microvirga rosea TaxID=2715425 RepID=UPI001D0A0578|nr:DUF1697 domain-containing protein [Microvirga rosea]MCB8823433.1 DUF1697 domain-containing protein [Microvirga rosea]
MALKVALMRSVVINGQRVKMADARALAERVGGTDVQSVIATGNLLFRSGKASRVLERELEAECGAFYGRATEIVVKTAEQWRSLLAANPFPGEAGRTPSRLLVWAMRDPIPDAGIAQLRRRAAGDERVERTPEGDFYIWFGDAPISGSRMASGFGLKALGAVGTNRNWNTAIKISRTLDAMAG